MAILEYLMNTEVVSSKGKQLEMMGLQFKSRLLIRMRWLPMLKMKN
ncbi:hypothetical protein [Pseudobutyrivibrio sp. MD2005]|nr:hypothetical protein [Pseudobutyrivibrio sp. MD2005]